MGKSLDNRIYTMNIKTFCITVLLLLVLVLNAHCAPIDVQRAQQIAENQLQTYSPLRGSKADLRLVYTSSGIPTRASNTLQDYYVFATPETGFVIVAGDDNVPEVLGYSYENSFVPENIPVQLQTWLKQCAQWVTQARKKSNRHLTAYLESEKKPIAPLLKGLKWNQSPPYNQYTPTFNVNGATVHAPVGCVATALSQIMRYYCWPKQGRGTINYSADGTNYYQKFDAVYDWNNMPNQVTTNSPAPQRKAVAVLGRDVGHAVQMNYGTEASGAYSENAMIAMRKYMRYANTTRIRLQDYYNYDEWTKVCLDELKAKRPIYYSGAAVGVGHAFVCDGYDGNGRFHFNWGWGGISNGYYVLTNLEPLSQGIGGGGEGGYVLSNQIITGLQPINATESAVEICCEKVVLPTQEQSKSALLKIIFQGLWNYSYDDLNVFVAVQVLDAQGEIVLESYTNSQATVKFRHGFKSFELNCDVNALQNGTYTVRPAFYDATKKIYYPAHVGALNPAPRFRVEGNKLIFGKISTLASLKLVSSSRKMNYNMQNTFDFTIQNTGTLPYAALIAGIYSAAADQLTKTPNWKNDLLFNRSIFLQPGEKQTFTLVLPGPSNTSEHFLQILYDRYGGSEDKWPKLADDTFYPGHTNFVTANLTIEPPYNFVWYSGSKPPYKTPYQLSFTEKFSTYESGSLMRVAVKVKAPSNKGVYAYLRGAIFTRTSDGKYRQVGALLRFPTLILRPNEEREVACEHILFCRPGKQYSLHLYDRKDGDHQLDHNFEFEVTGTYSDALPIPNNGALPDDPDAAISSSEHRLLGVSLGSNPTSGLLNLYLPASVVGQNLTIEIFDTTGRSVHRTAAVGESQLLLDLSHLTKGLYLIRVQTDAQQAATLRFVRE